MSGPVEESAGAPVINFTELMAQFMPEPPPPPPPPPPNDSVPGGPPGGNRQRERFQMPPGMREAIEEKQKEISEWRKNLTSMDKFKEIRDMYNKAGVNIHIVKFDNIGDDSVPDEELEYMFNVAKTMGAKGITTELNEMKAKRLAPFAQKHDIAIAFHNHTQLTPTTYSEGPYFSYGKLIMSNLDIGHFAAGTGQSALPLVKELAEQKRLLSIHVKDRTFGGDTVPFGEGDAQVAEILQLIKKNKWNIYCDIELEYPIPDGSDAIIETGKCVEYCKKVLS
jgi:sugar phosphate isomerase/epimerase